MRSAGCRSRCVLQRGGAGDGGAAHVCLCLSSLPTPSAPRPWFPHSWSWALVLWAETQSEASFPSLERQDSAEGESLRTGWAGLRASCPLLPSLMFD